MMFGEVLREARKSRGLTFRQLSEEVGVSNGVLNRYEMGYKFPKEKSLRSLCGFFDWEYKEMSFLIMCSKFGISDGILADQGTVYVKRELLRIKKDLLRCISVIEKLEGKE